jgi:putative SOS response-associated peptidase YedK
MCGRYVSTTTPHRLAEIFQADAGELDWHPRYNLAPSAPALVVDSHGAGRTVTQCRWGLIPHWSREDLGARLSNARGETVWEKPSFRDAARGHRVIVPMDAFYEWAPAAPDGPRTRAGRPAKRPHLFLRRDGGVLNVAGIASVWTRGETPIATFAVVTTAANGTMSPIHDRMPVILDEAGVDRWLDPDDQPEDLIRPASEELLEMWEVATEVNDVRNEGAHLMEPIESAPSTLF